LIARSASPTKSAETIQAQTEFAISTSPYNTSCLPSKILHYLCFPFLLGIAVVPRETKDNAYANILGANKVFYGDVEMQIPLPYFVDLSDGHNVEITIGPSGEKSLCDIKSQSCKTE